MNIEVGLLSLEDDEEMQEMYGPQCWYGTDADLGRLKKTMWLKGTQEFKLQGRSYLVEP